MNTCDDNITTLVDITIPIKEKNNLIASNNNIFIEDLVDNIIITNGEKNINALKSNISINDTILSNIFLRRRKQTKNTFNIKDWFSIIGWFIISFAVFIMIGNRCLLIPSTVWIAWPVSLFGAFFVTVCYYFSKGKHKDMLKDKGNDTNSSSGT